MRAGWVAISALLGIAGCHSFDEVSICDTDAQLPSCPGFVMTDSSGMEILPPSDTGTDGTAEDALSELETSSNSESGDVLADVAESGSDGADDADDAADTDPLDTSPTCAPNETRCNGRTVERCLATGAWSSDTNCRVACGAGQCITVVDLATTIGSSNCAILSDKTVRCWGYTTDGQFGFASATPQVRPTAFPQLTGARAIALSKHGCVIAADGSVACWGRNIYGQLGDGSQLERLTPGPTLPPLVASEIALNLESSCALATNGKIYCWGDKLILRASATLTSPTLVAGVGSASSLVSSGSPGACALSGSSVTCWGEGLVPGPAYPGAAVSGSYTAIWSGISDTCAARADSAVTCWGFNSNGEFGYTPGGVVWPPAPAPGWNGATFMAMGFGFVCGIFDPGIVRCAGSNKFGQLGDGTKVTRANVADVPGLFTVVRLIAGAAHACALNTYGEVYCWGANDSGQLGDGTTTDRSSPGLVQF